LITVRQPIYSYTEKGIKRGAGVQVIGAKTAAQVARLAVVSGSFPTVIIAGGYSQGGGLGPLASAYGLAADQVLE
jgi:hypothetical protein